MNWIENICEPRVLILAWQAPDQAGDRNRWAVGEIKSDNGTLALHYFSESDFSLLNPGRTISELKRLGYREYPGFRLSENTHREGVYEAFMRRLPPRSRPDFAEYLRHFGLRQDIAISDFALLGCTEAKLPSDGFSIVNPLDCGSDQLELLLEVAGHRYHATNPPAITVDDPVTFVAEPDNKVDPDAIMICRRGRCIGYVNRLQTKAFHRWLANNQVDGVVERLNGHPERPRVFVFVKIRPKPQGRIDPPSGPGGLGVVVAVRG